MGRHVTASAGKVGRNYFCISLGDCMVESLALLKTEITP